MTQLPFADRPPTDAEVERIRLILSTYQDGTGMLQLKDGSTLPGWRDFERAVALALGGEAQESKAVFDVILSAPDSEKRPKYGISCKMRRELNRIKRDDRVTIEVSNAAGEFWDALELQGVTKANYAKKPDKAGTALATVVHGWHQAVGAKNGGTIDLDNSYYLILLWNKKLEYQLFQFPLELWEATKLVWSVPTKAKEPRKEGRRLCGHDGTGNLIEWYGSSGGQLKLYPFTKDAAWKSGKFHLEPLPEDTASIIGKAESYFPEKWAAVKP